MNGITVDEFNELVSFFYEEETWSEAEGQDIKQLVPIIDYQDIFAYVGNVSFTAYFKQLEQGNKHVKRLYTNPLVFDDRKEIFVKHNNETYQIVRLLKGDIFEYDMELILDERN